MDVLPAAKGYVALYLQHITEASSSRAAPEEAIYALAWAHDLAGVASPNKGILVQTTLQGLRRLIFTGHVKAKDLASPFLSSRSVLLFGMRI